MAPKYIQKVNLAHKPLISEHIIQYFLFQKLPKGCLEEALDRCCDYIKKLETNDIKYPHRNYEIGTVAMNSCWWGIIARQNLLQPGLRIDNVE